MSEKWESGEDSISLWDEIEATFGTRNTRELIQSLRDLRETPEGQNVLRAINRQRKKNRSAEAKR